MLNQTNEQMMQSAFQRAMAQAQQSSVEFECCQHVNCPSDGYYVVSDWYDCDQTVASFSNGKQIS